MRIAVIGANGQLGTDVVRAAAAAGHEIQELTHSDIEVAERRSVETALRDARPDVVVNTAAMHHVESCEEDPERAFAVNAFGARNVAMVAARESAVVVHISTDYVFGGEKRQPYVESDLPAPLNVYGTSKLAGEHFVRAANPRHFVVRTSAIYGVNRCRAKSTDNFVRMMLQLGRGRDAVRVVADERVSPTWSAEIGRQLLALAATERYGLYHATAQGDCSWYEYARAIFEIAGLDVRVDTATAADFPAKVRRPAYSVLDNAALRAAGLELMSHWRDALQDYLAVIGETRASKPPDMTVAAEAH